MLASKEGHAAVTDAARVVLASLRQEISAGRLDENGISGVPHFRLQRWSTFARSPAVIPILSSTWKRASAASATYTWTVSSANSSMNTWGQSPLAVQVSKACQLTQTRAPLLARPSQPSPPS